MPVVDLPSVGNAAIPMDPSGDSVNESEYRRMLRYMTGAGTNICIGGRHATEFAHLSDVERQRIWEISVDELGGKAQVNAIPSSPASTTEMIATFRRAQAMGFDAVQLYPGAAGGRGDDGLFIDEGERYFRDILEAVDVPTYLNAYAGGEVIDSPNKRFPFDRIVALVEDYPQLVGVTVMSDDNTALSSLIAAVEGRCRIRVTGGEVCFEMLELGVYGFHSIQPCFAPTLCATMLSAYHGGDRETAKALSATLAELCHVIHTPRYHYPRSIKPVLNHLGFDAGGMRRPYLPLSDALQRELTGRIDELELGRFEQWESA